MKSMIGALVCVTLVYAGCAWIVTLDDDEIYAGEKERNPYWHTVVAPTLAPQYRQYADERPFDSKHAAGTRRRPGSVLQLFLADAAAHEFQSLASEAVQMRDSRDNLAPGGGQGRRSQARCPSPGCGVGYSRPTIADHKADRRPLHGYRRRVREELGEAP